MRIRQSGQQRDKALKSGQKQSVSEERASECIVCVTEQERKSVGYVHVHPDLLIQERLDCIRTTWLDIQGRQQLNNHPSLNTTQVSCEISSN